MRIHKIALTLLFSGSLLFAQQKLTMNEAILGLRSNLRVENYWYPAWIKSSNSLTYFKNGEYLLTNAETQKTETLLTLNDINTHLPKQEQLSYLPLVM